MKYLLSSFLVLLGFNIFVWSHIIFTHDNSLNVFFMDVGQGDSELIILPGGVKVLIDGGPNKSVLFELDKVLQQMDRYRSEEHTSELQSHSFISYAVFCLKKKINTKIYS